MPLYTYRAIDPQGKVQSGTLDAANLPDLELRLDRMHLDLVHGKPLSKKKYLGLGGRGIRRQELITFCFHLEQLTQAGVPLLEGLSDLRDSVDNLFFRSVVADLIENIQGGKRLSEAMNQHPKIFDRVFCSLVRAGEETGRLNEVFHNLTETLKWQDEIAAQAKKAIMYPAFVGTVVLGVTFFMMIFLVPKLVGFIRNMGQELPLHTKALIFLSNIFIHYWYLILALPVLAALVISAAAKTSPSFRFWLDGVKLRVWMFGPIFKKIILARFTNSFALLYSSGITVLEALRNCEHIVANEVVSDGLRRVGTQIAEGQGMTLAFENTGLFPPLVIRMMKVGETTGALDSALRNVNYFYDREVKESIGRIQAMIEPVMTVVLGAMLGWVMLAVIGPIYDTISKIKL